MGNVAWLAAALLLAPARAAGRDAAIDLLVVTPAALRPALGEYLEHRRLDLAVDCVDLEAALESNEGADDPERLKRYLYARLRADGIRYVLLVGDADVMPVRYMVLDRITAAAFDHAFYPSDLYYADLADERGDFEDWNAARDGHHAGYFGEVHGERNKDGPINFDDIDYRPDVAVGRWPVSTPEEAALVAAKTIAFERGLAAGAHPGAGRAAFAMVDGWVDARGAMDRMAARLEPAWTVDRLYGGGAGDPPDAEHIAAHLDRGVGILLHAGHGTDHGWAGSISTRSIEDLENADRLAIIMSAGCSTARFATLPPYEPYIDVDGALHAGTNAGEVFDGPPPAPHCYPSGPHNPTGLGEQMLRARATGAVAYIGCNTGSQPCGLTLMSGFVDAIASSPGARLGDCWSSAVAAYWEREGLATIAPTESWYPASIFFQGMKFMLFGDPSLALPRAEPPTR